MIIAIGADHRGYALKQEIQQQLSHVTWHDCGTDSSVRTDYPIYAHAVVRELLTGKAEQGILLCGTGAGMAIAANRHPGIYAAVAWNIDIARRAKEEDYVNVLVIPADYLNVAETIAIIRAWLSAKPKDERYKERIAMIDQQ
jgi:RpiB/LacA/LacB family sugar-phosphate isomerase